MKLDYPHTPAAAIERFRLLVRQRIVYQLEGCPTWNPVEVPAVGAKGNCSIAAIWALGQFIHQPLDVWLNSSGIVKDAITAGGLFTRVARAVAGALIVFPWADGHPGHVGMVTEAEDGRPTRVIHCSPRNGREDSVRETGPEVFLARADTIFAWFSGFESHPDRPVIDPPLGTAQHIHIYTTEFGGGLESGMSSAYGGKVDPKALQAALPARVSPDRRRIAIRNPANGIVVRNVLVNDVGPHNKYDRYFETAGARPLAEAQFGASEPAQNGHVPTQPAGLDVTPAVMDALKVPGQRNLRSAPLDFWFE